MDEVFYSIAEECCQRQSPARRGALAYPAPAKPGKAGGPEAALPHSLLGRQHPAPPTPATPLHGAAPHVPQRLSSDSSGSEAGRRSGVARSSEWGSGGGGWAGAGEPAAGAAQGGSTAAALLAEHPYGSQGGEYVLDEAAFAGEALSALHSAAGRQVSAPPDVDYGKSSCKIS